MASIGRAGGESQVRPDHGRGVAEAIRKAAQETVAPSTGQQAQPR